MEEFNYDYSYLEGFIKQKFGTRRKAAEFLGISTTALGYKLKGKTAFSQDEITLFRQKFNLSGQQILQLFFCL